MAYQQALYKVQQRNLSNRRSYPTGHFGKDRQILEMAFRWYCTRLCDGALVAALMKGWLGHAVDNSSIHNKSNPKKVPLVLERDSYLRIHDLTLHFGMPYIVLTRSSPDNRAACCAANESSSNRESTHTPYVFHTHHVRPHQETAPTGLAGVTLLKTHPFSA